MSKTTTLHNTVNNKFLPLLGMLYLLSILTGYIFVQKETALPMLGIFSVGVFAYPLSFVILDVIAETYGYQSAKLIVYYNIITEIIFCILITVLLQVHSIRTYSTYAPAYYYQKIFGVIPRIAFSSIIALLISSNINAYLLTKWKVLLKGRYLWLRSVGSSFIGITIFVSLAVTMITIGRYPWVAIFQFISNSWLISIAELIVFSYPALLTCRLLAKIEQGSKPIGCSTAEFNPFADS